MWILVCAIRVINSPGAVIIHDANFHTVDIWSSMGGAPLPFIAPRYDAMHLNREIIATKLTRFIKLNYRSRILIVLLDKSTKGCFKNKFVHLFRRLFRSQYLRARISFIRTIMYVILLVLGSSITLLETHISRKRKNARIYL